MSAQEFPDDVNITQVILKKIIWDVVPDEHVADMCRVFEMVGDSPDVTDMEMNAARARRNTLEPIAPTLNGISLITAAVIERYFRTNGKDISDSVPQIINGAVIAVLANLVELDLLHLPHYASH